MLLYLIQGIIIGALISVPVGPVNVMCFQITMQNGHTHGYISTIGATLADTIFAILAVSGLGLVINFIEEFRSIFEISSSFILIGFGIVLILNNTYEVFTANKEKSKKATGMLASFLFTISNPLTVLFFITYLASVNHSNAGLTTTTACLFVIGVVVGSTSWFYSLSRIVNRYKRKINIKYINILNNSFGAILLLSGVVIICKTCLI